MAELPEQMNADAGLNDKPKSKLLLIIVGLVTVLIVITVISFMLLGGSGGEDLTATAIKEDSIGYMYKFETPFTGNLSPPDDQYIYNADITLEITPRNRQVTEPEALKELGLDGSDEPRNKMPIIRQIIYDEISTKTRIELTSSAGKMKLRNTIKNELNAILNKAQIKNVYINIIVN